MDVENLFQNLPTVLSEEVFEKLVEHENVLIERIVSKGHSSPESGWYDQEKNEWVIVMQGEAKLRLQKDNQLLHLLPGMYVNIPAHTKHKVEWTHPDQETIWLAVHY